MSKPPLLITGGSGYLGQHLIPPATEQFTVYTTYYQHPIQIQGCYLHQLDLTNTQAVSTLIHTISPQVIIHTAKAERNASADTLTEVNAVGTRTLSESASQIGARFIYLSTDVVHNGQQPFYSDDDPASATTAYGQSKATGEAIIRQMDPSAIIIRTSLIYGLTVMDHGTASFGQRLEEGQSVTLFRDQFRQPIWVQTLVATLLKLATSHSHLSGTLNIAGRQSLSREDFGRRMLAYWGIEAQDRIFSGLAANLPNPPPLNIHLQVEQAERLLGMTFPGVDTVLQEQNLEKKE